MNKESLLLSLLLVVCMTNAVLTTTDTSKCHEDLIGIPGNPNGPYMIDYTGKAVDDMGNYDGCKLLPEDVAHYCVLEGAITFTHPRESIPIYLGVCAPASCDEIELHDEMGLLFKYLIYNGYLPPKFNASNPANSVSIHCIPRTPEKFTAGAIIAMIICGILAVLLISGTLLECDIFSYIKNLSIRSKEFEETKGLIGEKGGINSEPLERRQSVGEMVLRSFGMVGNMKWLLADNSEGGASPLSSLNGLRALMMSWVILGHTFTYMTLPVGFDNIQTMQQDLVRRVSWQVVPAAELAVDAFFYLSGFLVVFMLLKEMKQRSGRINWFLFYFHRYWRLTPVFALIMLVYTTLTPYMIHGPFQYKYREQKTDFCVKYWWTNLLYINNFYPTSSAHQCMGWSWYLANDWQFYLITPLFAIVYRRKRSLAWILVGSLTVLSMLANALLTHFYDLSPIDPNDDKYNSYLYNKPYCRIATYLIGVMVAYLVQHERDYVSNWTVRWIGYAASFAATFCSTYLTYGYWRDGWNPTQNLMYNTFARVAFTLGIGFVMYATYHGHGGALRKFLSLYIWVPIARLTYTAYLVHPAVMFLINYNNTTAFHYTAIYATIRYISHLALAYGTGLLFHIVLEKPTSNLERIMLPKRQH